MAISFISNALGATNSTTSFSITLPTTQANDILICEFTHRGTGNGTIGGTSVTTGGLTWTLKHSQLYATSAFSGKTYWTRATGDHAGQTVTGSSLTNSCAAILTVYRGCVTTGDPLADATIVGEQNASGNETQAEITTATNGAYVVLVVANSPDVAVSTQACTSPGTLAERAERLSTGGTDTSIAHASEAKATAGATGALTWAQTNGASGSWAYALVPANPVLVTPGVLAMTITTFAPIVTATANVLVTVGLLALTLTTFAPTVTVAPAGVLVTPDTATLTLTTFAPTVTASDHQTVTPGTLALTTTTFAPTVSITNNQLVTPLTASLIITTYAPDVTATESEGGRTVNQRARHLALGC